MWSCDATEAYNRNCGKSFEENARGGFGGHTVWIYSRQRNCKCSLCPLKITRKVSREG